MPVSSSPLPPQKPVDLSLLLGRVGMVLCVLSFGGLLWAINGGFSVIGLERMALMFNASGRVFWAIMTLWRFEVPTVPGLPGTQPIVPWIGVSAASMLQIAVIYRRAVHLPIPRSMFFAALVLSAYDLATTFFGLASMPWLQSTHPAVVGLLALILTFVVEFIFSFALKGAMSWKRVSK
jgi:hypothetical protein